ncbi:hypothetical protein TorRG33x02_020250 [Trema orientale]|uniref:Uncharacterized protein n=1 Tax=Trema orientale TaxID=63057 RepID=A0A2P5FWR1_TREOI|nr:hypothetical protein TorRG33x02_020250 [Trema orientale]
MQYKYSIFSFSRIDPTSQEKRETSTHYCITYNKYKNITLTNLPHTKIVIIILIIKNKKNKYSQQYPSIYRFRHGESSSFDDENLHLQWEDSPFMARARELVQRHGLLLSLFIYRL